MNRKLTLDITIIISSIAGAVLSYAYLQKPIEKYTSLIVLAAVTIFFLVMTIRDAAEGKRFLRYDMKRAGISELLLLGEDNNVTDTWDIYGKTSIVFGRDEGDFQVDVNLKNTDYAGTVDGEHAVMNYSGGGWYIEDLDSENGTRSERGGEGKRYTGSSREPCR
ncbi:MAG: FHA domain-containing protein, partial [Lachnospiraceae bacterium]|nr:FHA domain-containing protein [Lachnospiraceae bacterium]